VRPTPFPRSRPELVLGSMLLSLLLVGILGHLLIPPPARAAPWMIWENKRISSSGAGHNPRIHGRYVVWQQSAGAKNDLVVYDIDTGVEKTIPRSPWLDYRYFDLQGGLVAIEADDDYQNHSYIYLYDIAAGSAPQRLTTAVPSEEHPSLSMGRVVWSGFDGQDWELFLFAGGAVTRVTNNTADEREPWFDGEWVASVGNKWSASQSDDDAAVTNVNGTSSRLLRGSLHDKSIRVRGNHVVWLSGQQSSFFDDEGEVWLHDIAANKTQRISSDLDNTLLQIDGGRVVWVDEAPSYYQTEIVVYDIATGQTQRLNKSKTDDNMPNLSGHQLVWVTDTRVVWFHDFDTATTEWVYDAAPPTAAVDPQVSQGNVVWVGGLGSGPIHLARKVPFEPPPVFQFFKDVGGNHPYNQAIHGLRSAGAVSGYGDNTFRPDNNLWRAQFAKMIVEALSLTDAQGQPVSESLVAPFTDLGPDDPTDLYHHDYIALIADIGVTVGKTPTTFAPWDEVSRAQVISMVVRAAQQGGSVLAAPPAGYQSALGDFSPNHAENVQLAEFNGLTAGLVGYGSAWNPWTSATRGECAQIIWNLYKK
jgi:hypothetical protein